MDNITFTDASRLRVSPRGVTRRAIVHAVWRSNGSTSTVYGSTVTLTTWARGGGDTVNHAELAALHEAIRHAPAQHHQTDRLQTRVTSTSRLHRA
jgi:hypothetical protein